MTLTAQRTVVIDATATAATGVLMLAARNILYPFFGLGSPMLLDIVAITFIAYAALIGVIASRSMISPAVLMTIVTANVAYVVASVTVLIAYWGQFEVVGRALIIAVTLVVEAFAALQWSAARRMTDSVRIA